MEIDKLKPILEALFSASDKPLSVSQLFELFVGDIEQPSKDEIRKAIEELVEKYEGSGFELKQVASGFRFQDRSPRDFASRSGSTSKHGLSACGSKNHRVTRAH
jgi:chromosome segregation and condensation protein ScpB